MNILDRSIDECKTFQEISEWRVEKNRIDIKSGDNYKGILTNIYKEPTHFIYELLQNADDAKAVNVKFILSKDKIEFCHDGTKEFSLNDIISITGVGNSSKENQDSTTIGKFGVGFKAVFAVTEKPLIYSTTYNFEIENLSVPFEISGRELDKFTTIFQLNFKSIGREILFSRNESLLRNMSPETIMFLKNICTVSICINGEQLPAISVSRQRGDQLFDIIKYQKNEDSIELLKFSDNGRSIVYKLRNNCIVPVTGSKISVFFPTIVDSNLSFIVDAPFQTSTTRESIDFELPYNKSIIEKFSDIFSNSIEKLKLLDLFSVDTFNDIMPIDIDEELDNSPIYNKLHETFYKNIKTQSLIPTSHNTLLSAPEVLIANDTEIINLLSNVACVHFAHQKLSSSAKTLIKLAGASIFEPVNLLKLINEGGINLGNKTDEWLYGFYEYCLKSMIDDSWSRIFSRTIKNTAIIRTKSGTFTAAFFNDNPNVFRPSKGIPDHRTIHPMFLTEASTIRDETKGRMKNLLSELGITERKPVIVLKEDYFRDYSKKSSDEKIEIFKTTAEIYQQSEPRDKIEIEVYLKNIPFVPSATDEFKSAMYLYDSYNPDLKFFLNKNHPELFCDDFIGENATYREMCLKLGLINHLDVKESKVDHSNRAYFLELYQSVNSSQDYGISTKDYTRINYRSQLLDVVFSNKLSIDFTSRLIPLLMDIQPNQLKEIFKWQYYGTKEELIGPSTLCNLLIQTAWIARDEQMVRPTEISFDDFCDIYKLPHNNVLQNLEWSNDGIIKQLSNRDQEAIRLIRELDLSPEEMYELRRTALEKRKKTEHLSNKLSTPIEELHNYEQPEGAEEEIDDIQDEILTTEHEYITLNASESYEAADTHRSQAVTTRIAAESDYSNVELEERDVLKGLIDWYKGDGYITEKQDEDRAAYTLQKDAKVLKVMLLPKNQSGYNIEISENDKIIKTIAVIKADLEKKKFIISESQWDLLKRNDIQHSIYLVSRHGGSMSQIVIDDLRERVRNGSVRAVPGVIYYR